MHGCGNDYIYVDCFTTEIAEPEKAAIYLSDRHFGVGGDGLVLICPSQTADAKMRMFNLDGSEGAMCGNAIRCVGKYLYDSGKIKKETLAVETKSGIKTLALSIEDGEVSRVKVDMGRAEFLPEKIPVMLSGDSVVRRQVSIAGGDYEITCVSMGNPHCVVFCDEPNAVDLSIIGPLFENASIFPERINTEFVKVIDKNSLRMRVWERGSGETLACGTGACASAAAAVRCGYCPEGEDIKVELLGGELTICVTADSVTMEGGAVKVFDGTIALPE